MAIFNSYVKLPEGRLTAGDAGSCLMLFDGTRGLKWSYLSEPPGIIAMFCAVSRTPRVRSGMVPGRFWNYLGIISPDPILDPTFGV